MADLFGDCAGYEDGPYLPRTPRARATDPSSSHLAAQEAVESGRVKGHCKIVLRLVRENPGLTSVELHHAQGMDGTLERHEISRRLSDLMRAGLVCQGEQRACTVRKAQMVTWFLARPEHG